MITIELNQWIVAFFSWSISKPYWHAFILEICYRHKWIAYFNSFEYVNIQNIYLIQYISVWISCSLFDLCVWIFFCFMCMFLWAAFLVSLCINPVCFCSSWFSRFNIIGSLFLIFPAKNTDNIFHSKIICWNRWAASIESEHYPVVVVAEYASLISILKYVIILPFYWRVRKKCVFRSKLHFDRFCRVRLLFFTQKMVFDCVYLFSFFRCCKFWPQTFHSEQ